MKNKKNFKYSKKAGKKKKRKDKKSKGLKDTKPKANENIDNNACHINYPIVKTAYRKSGTQYPGPLGGTRDPKIFKMDPGLGTPEVGR